MRLWSTHRRQLFTVAAVAVSGVLLVGGLAAANGSSNTYTGCLVHGVLVNVAIGDTPKRDCPSSSTQVQWNKTGPRGPRGIQGEQGIPGPADLQVTLRETSETFTVPPFDEAPVAERTAGGASFCMVGEVVLSGGVTGGATDFSQLRLVNSGPIFDGRTSGWGLTWANPTDEPLTVTVTVAASCAPGAMSVE